MIFFFVTNALYKFVTGGDIFLLRISQKLKRFWRLNQTFLIFTLLLKILVQNRIKKSGTPSFLFIDKVVSFCNSCCPAR